MSDVTMLPFERPLALQNSKRMDTYKALYLFDLNNEGHTWVLIFHHGKANEVGLDVLNELEHLVEELEGNQSPQTLITLSLRRSRKGKAIFIAGANVTERADWDNQRVKIHVR